MTKVLLVFYTWSGNTKKLAGKITNQYNTDEMEIKVPENTFSTDMNKTSDIANKQILNNAYPDIQIDDINFNNYDLILVGSPTWSGMPATPIHTFLSKLQNANYQGQVASFHTDVKMYLEKYEPTFKSWGKNLNIIGSCHNDEKIDEWIKGVVN